MYQMPPKSRIKLRKAVFDAMKVRNAVDDTGVDTLMAALVEFYYPSPAEEDLITLDNSSLEEIEIATNFFSDPFVLKRQRLSSDSPEYISSLRINTSGLAYLRIELLPHFVKPADTRNRLLDIYFYEDELKTCLAQSNPAILAADAQNNDPIAHAWWNADFKRVRFESDPLREYSLQD